MGRGRSRSRSRERDRKRSSEKKSSSKGDSWDRDSRSDRAPVSGSSSHRDDKISSSAKESHSRRDRGRDAKDKDSYGSLAQDRDYGRLSRARGSSAGRSRSRSRDTDKDYRASSSSRRGDRDHRDRHHKDSSRRDRKYRDRDRHRDHGSERERKRSRGSGGSSRRYGKYNSDSDDGRGRDGGGNPEEAWKRKPVDEDEQILDIDPDDLMIDEEEEERRLEEERRKRQERLEAMRQKAVEAEEAKKLAEENAAKATTSDNGVTDNGHSSNGQRAKDDSGNDESYDSADDDAGPIEITKQGSGQDASMTNTDDDVDEDDVSGAQNDQMAHEQKNQAGKPAKIPAAGTVNGGEGPASDRGTSSSSEARAKQGKEDRPVFDMFSAASLTAGAVGPGATKIGGKGGGGDNMAYRGGDGVGDQGNWTDVEGYYKTRVGEVIGGRYTVLGTVGQGVFSTVLKCLDTRAGPGTVGGASEVALKMIRNNDTMRKAAQKEVALLKELAEHDPANKKHCIRLLSSLEHKQHTVMVFESMQMNLRETLKKFGRKTGINIHAVQKYAKQLMAALKHMASRNLVHADIKPDNILVDQGFGSLKLADFGSAFRETDPDNDPTPYLVSRWYRAPEIVLGLEYDKAIDLWSVAVTLFELYKGSPVIPGVNNNEMLKRMMELKGPVPQRMIKTHIRAFETLGGIRPHFNERGEFMQQEPDPVSGQTTVRLVTVTAPSKPIKTDIMRSKGQQDKKETVANLADFLDKCMSLDPRQRMSLEQCAAHGFLRR